MPPDPSRIIELANAFYGSCVLFTASDLGVFGKLAELGEADAPTLASALGLEERGARLLLDGAVSIGLLDKRGEHYRNTRDSSIFLVPGSPADLSRAIRYNRDVYSAWQKLPELARTGKPVERPQLHLGDDRQRTRDFVLSMHGRALGVGRGIVPLLKLAGRKRLLDVGGGPGTYSVLIAQANPDLHCTVLDLPAVAAIARELVAQQGQSERVQVMAGDYHTTPFPQGVDVVNFFGMLHQESPDSIRDLMRRAYDALEPGGVVYVLDMMTDESHTRPQYSALFAVNMALTTDNGWVFSDTELRGWMEEAGFRDFQVAPVPPPMPHWLATARK
jgi:SAM-dependent methyltransferase